MSELNVMSKPNQGGLLALGRHLVTIESIEETVAAAADEYSDRTPQIKVVYKSDDGQITHWYNLKGFKANEDGEYEVGDDGKRIEDEEKTASCMSILGQVANSAGTPTGETVDFFGLVGAELGIEVIENERGNKRVAYTTPAADAQPKEAESLV